MNKNEVFINRCISLALNGLGETYPNPAVGAVVVHKGKIIGEGWHKKAGGNHAEINAINSVKNKDLLKESEIYVSLEPCSHFGKTPPCALKIIEYGFKKVIFGATDTNADVSGKGKQMLENAAIEVVSGVLEEECRFLNKRFFTFHEKKRPFIILKWAQSADGFLDKNFKPVQISNSLSKQYVHKLRSEEHAVLVGTKTALNDNPSLTTREIMGRNPVRILLDLNLKVPKNFNIFNGEVETIVLNYFQEKTENNVKFVKIEKENFLENLMNKLHGLQIQSVIVEGGRFTLQQFIDAGLWDESLVIKAENLFLKNGTAAPIFNFKPLNTRQFRSDIIYFYKNKL